ncbi:hypothetical protein HNQ77_002960 [Silvibacterium bohemicum]|uniref:Uncharacterized protein n=1 Tax=Silvibacterium bohemicum TaxID=1577686 RepID=A0A841K421_9BACT|nr:hypothetical protein [Silvibacterium bohemicum]MBB6145004.1 hypothetical protein [Silvibacterium bohemicum]
MSGVRIAASSTNSSTAAPQSAAAAHSAGGAFQALLASVAEVAAPGNGLIKGDAKTLAAFDQKNAAAEAKSGTQDGDASSVIENGQTSGAASDETGVSTLSTATGSAATTGSAQLTSTQNIPSNLILQAVVANASGQDATEDSSALAGAKAHSVANAGSGGPAKQEKTQVSAAVTNAGANVASPILPTDKAVSLPWNLPNGVANSQQSGQQASGGAVSGGTAANGSSLSATETLDARLASLMRNVPQQAVTPQVEAGPAEHAVPQAKPSASSPDATLDGQTSAATSANASAQASVAQQDGANAATQLAGQTFTLPINLAATTGLAGNSDAGQAMDKSVQKLSSDSASKNPDVTSVADLGKKPSGDAVSGTADASSQSAQNNGQPTPHSQSGASDPALPAVKVADGGAAMQVQAQTIQAHVASHETASASRATDGADIAPRQSETKAETVPAQVESGEAAATSGVNTAKLIQTINESEIRVGMHSNEFGDISIRTSVSQQQMLAQISLDHGDLSQAISAHISSVQTKLGNEYGLHTVIEVNNQGSSFSGNSGQSSQSQQDHRAYARSGQVESVEASMEADSSLSPVAMAATGDGYRLDIQA